MNPQTSEAIAASIVSSSVLLREGLPAVLGSYIRLQWIASYPGLPVGAEPFTNPSGHIVLLDSGIGREACLEWTRFCRGRPTPARVLILEMVNDVNIILECIEAGASGYTLQGATPAEVAGAIVQVRRGLAQCSPEVTAQLFARLASLGVRQPPRLPVSVHLTSREIEVLNCIARGYSNRQIADELVIELRTVKQHVHNILDKLKVSHRWEAARFAQEQGWLPKSGNRVLKPSD